MRISLKKMTNSATSRSEARSSELQNRRVGHSGPPFRALSQCDGLRLKIIAKILGPSRRTSTPKIVTLEARVRPKEGLSKKRHFCNSKEKKPANKSVLQCRETRLVGRPAAKILVNPIERPSRPLRGRENRNTSQMSCIFIAYSWAAK